MATSTVGKQAESSVAEHLKSLGYKILAQNWKTPRCEIDVIALKGKVAYLVEVKYRSANSQGSGFEYIGPHKLRQVKYAAQVWANDSAWDGDIQLLAAEVSGTNFDSVELVEL